MREVGVCELVGKVEVLGLFEVRRYGYVLIRVFFWFREFGF